jgi:hypothetical protein
MISMRGLVVPLMALLAGCGADTSVLGPPYYASYEPGEYTAQRVIPVVVRGDPFARPGEDVAFAVAAAMQGNTYFPAQLWPATVDPRESYRVVVLFSPPANYDYGSMCSAPVLPSGPQQKGRVPVSAALCRWDVLLAGVSGKLDAPAPDDPAFRAGMGQVARMLFPGYNNEVGNRGDGGPRGR